MQVAKYCICTAHVRLPKEQRPDTNIVKLDDKKLSKQIIT